MDMSSMCSNNVSLLNDNTEYDFDQADSVRCRQSLKSKFDDQFRFSGNFNTKFSSHLSVSNRDDWCDALSTSFANVYSKQAWQKGTKKLTQTFNNVRTTIGAISQKIKKSTKQRQPLVNIDSPTSVTPRTRSKSVLGRTPTKLYSPFGIDTPKGRDKENIPNRRIMKKKSPHKARSVRRKLQQTVIDSEGQENVISSLSEANSFHNSVITSLSKCYPTTNKIVPN